MIQKPNIHRKPTASNSKLSQCMLLICFYTYSSLQVLSLYSTKEYVRTTIMVQKKTDRKNHTKNTRDLISVFDQLCLGLQLHSSYNTFLLSKLRVYKLQLVFKYYGPFYKNNHESYQRILHPHTPRS